MYDWARSCGYQAGQLALTSNLLLEKSCRSCHAWLEVDEKRFELNVNAACCSYRPLGLHASILVLNAALQLLVCPDQYVRTVPWPVVSLKWLLNNELSHFSGCNLRKSMKLLTCVSYMKFKD